MSGHAANVKTGTTGEREVRSGLALATVCLGLLMILLDLTMVDIAVPHILDGFGAHVSTVEWVMNAFSLTLAVSLVVCGRLGDFRGRRLLFLLGIAVFTVATVACALAPSIGFLIGFRIVEGLGAAMILPQTLSIISDVFPPAKRAAAIGIWSGVYGLATAIGPSLSGAVVDAAGWRYIFLINLPVAAAAALLAWRFVPESRQSGGERTLDVPGAALLSSAMFCVTFAVIEGQRLGWSSAVIIGLFAGCVVLLAGFVVRERHCSNPLVDFSLFRDVNFGAGNATALILAFVMLGTYYVLSLFLQAILGYSAVTTGAILSPMSVALIVAAAVAGRVSARGGSRWLIAGGLALTAFGIAVIAGLTPLFPGLTPDTAAGSLILPAIVAGLGIGLAVAPLTTAVMATVPSDKAGVASGTVSTMRELGGVIGIAVLGAILENRTLHNATAGIEQLPLPAAGKEELLAQLHGHGTVGGHSLIADHLQGLFQVADDVVARLIQVWSSAAANTTFTVAVIVACAGAILGLAVRGARTEEALARMSAKNTGKTAVGGES